MADNLQKGKEGEEKAATFLTEKGYNIIHRNYRSGKGEIDLIALVENLLVFIEVKSRSRTTFGFPEEAVSDIKAETIIRTAENYMEEYSWNGFIRFDIIAISGKKIDHFIDAFS